jgi:VWFA-related protein
MAMNRVVRLGDLLVRQGILGIVLLLPCLLAGQQQSVPDAPTPQQQKDSLGNLTQGVTPGKGSEETPQDGGTNTTQVPPNQAPPATGSQPSGQDQVQQQPPVIEEPGQRNKDITTFSTRVDYVTVPVTVLDKKHQQVAGLTWRDFQIYENNQRQRIAFFSPGDQVPLSVALVIDQSLPQDTMKKVNDSLAAIQGAFTAADEIAVYTYADGVNNPSDFTAALGARVPAVLAQSKKAGDYMGVPINGGPLYGGPTINGRSVDPNLDPQRGNSGFGVVPKEIHTLNDAILAAGKGLSTRPKGSRRIIYVISDGKESRSKATFREVTRYLESNKIAVYGTLVGDSATWGLGYLDKIKIPLLPLSPDNILPRYTDATGGHLYSEFSENGIQRSFAELAALARTQYTLGYYTHLSPLDNKFRVLDVRVLRPNLDVVAPKGYYPTATNMSR